MTVPEPAPITVWSRNNVVLDEAYYLRMTNAYTAPRDGRFEVTLDLHDWPGDYGLEILIMTYSDYLNYIDYESYSAWHLSLFTERTHFFNSGTIHEGELYQVIIDNTDLGWDDTDFDFVNDAAYFDVEAVFQGY